MTVYLRAVSMDYFKHKGSTQKVTALSIAAFVSVLINVFFTNEFKFLEWNLYCISLKHRKTGVCSIGIHLEFKISIVVKDSCALEGNGIKN